VKITIVNQSGNIKSIANIIKKCGYDVLISNKIDEIINSDKVILPGVGSFDHAIKNLKEMKIDLALNEFLKNKQNHLLGICLGMQLFFNKSEEGDENGLGLIDGEVLKFKSNDVKYKIPHMGWNYVMQNNKISKFNLMNHRFYFANSFYVKPNDQSKITYTSEYLLKFPSIIESDNIFGFQFHPEKSHNFGQKLFSQFLELK